MIHNVKYYDFFQVDVNVWEEEIKEGTVQRISCVAIFVSECHKILLVVIWLWPLSIAHLYNLPESAFI